MDKEHFFWYDRVVFNVKTNTMKKPRSHARMSPVIKAYTGSSFVGREIFPRLPRSIPIEFSLEFNGKGETFIAISSPEYSGIISEARTMDEAYENVHDAILTYFEVPKECAKAIKFKLVNQPKEKSKDGSSVLLRRIEIKQLAHA